MPENTIKPDMDSSMEEAKVFITTKYIQKRYIANHLNNPVQEYTKAREDEDVSPGYFYRSCISKYIEYTC